MFKEVLIKLSVIKVAFVICVMLAASSCSDANKNVAESLFVQARDLYDNQRYEESIKMLDSLKNNYKDNIDLLKKVLHLRVLNQKGLVKKEITTNDSLISELELENQELSKEFKYIKHKDMVEGYYIHKNIADKAGDDNRTTIEPRIDEGDMFYIVSYMKGVNVKHTSVSLVVPSAGEVTTSTVPYDKSRNYRYNSDGVSYESITFTNQECDTLGQFVVENVKSNFKLIFKGTKQHSVNLEPIIVKAIAQTYRYAINKKSGKSAIKKRMFLEQKLQLAQKQIEQTKTIE